MGDVNCALFNKFVRFFKKALLMSVLVHVFYIYFFVECHCISENASVSLFYAVMPSFYSQWIICTMWKLRWNMHNFALLLMSWSFLYWSIFKNWWSSQTLTQHLGSMVAETTMSHWRCYKVTWSEWLHFKPHRWARDVSSLCVCWLMKAARTVGLKHVKCTEDDDFMAAFDKMMSETLQVSQYVGIYILHTWLCACLYCYRLC